MVEIEWALGVFTMMAAMAAIIGGGIGVRLMHIDGEYKRVIDKLDQESSDTRIMDKDESYWKKTRDLSNIREKQADNRRGIRNDAICIIIILLVGLITSLGLSPNLSVSAIVTFITFLTAMITFSYHAQNVAGKFN